MDKTTVLKLAPNVLKRMEYNIEVFYLLNFNNDEIWAGNYSSYLFVSKLNGVLSIDEVIKSLAKDFEDYTYEELYNASTEIFKDLSEKDFLVIV